MIRKWILDHKVLSAILIAGFVLRVIPVLWGIPFSPFVRSYHPDEPKVYASIVKFPGVYWSTEPFLAYGTSLQYTLGMLLLPVKAVLVKLLGQHHLYKTVVILSARLASVLMGTGTVLLCYRLAEKLFDKRTAVLSALFLATSFYHTMNSAIITVDVAMSFLLTVNILVCFWAVEREGVRPYVVLGVTTGLLIGTKLPAAVFGVVPLFLEVGNATATPGRAPARADLARLLRRFMAYGATALAVFLVFHPHILLDPGKFIRFFQEQKVDWLVRLETSFGGMIGIWWRSLGTALGGGAAWLALSGMVFCGRDRLKHKAALIMFVIVYLAFWRWSMKPRYVIALAPILCMFAAHACASVAAYRWKPAKWIAGAAAGAVLAFSVYSVAAGINLRLNDTRPPAARYLAETFPPGSTLGIAGVSEQYTWKTHPWEYPRIDFSRFRKTDFLDDPEIVVMSSYAFKRALRTLESGRLGPGYSTDGIDRRKWYKYSPPSPRIFEFYDRLLNKKDDRYVLVKTFKIDVKVPLEFPPPEIRIYRRTS